MANDIPRNECGPRIDSLESMRAEITEAVELMRAHFPDSKEMTLRRRAGRTVARRYHEEQWPDFSTMAKEEALRNCRSRGRSCRSRGRAAEAAV